MRCRRNVTCPAVCLHLDEKRGSSSRQVVPRADAGEHAVKDSEAHRRRRHERAHMRHHRNGRDLTDVRRLAGHVRTGDEHDLVRRRVEKRRIRHERLRIGELLDDRMASVDNLQNVRVVHRRSHVPRRKRPVGKRQGRGTSTFDGISIAWSVAEYLHGKPQAKAKTLFATHYHELTDLADTFAGVKNYTVKVKEEGGRIVFLRRIAAGVAEKSFSIHVGAMAGLPEEVVTRASQILKNLEANDIDVNAQKVVRKPRKKLTEMPGQMTFF